MKSLKNFSEVLFKSTLMVLIVAFTFAACKKDHDKNGSSNAAVEGLYVGKYGFDNADPDTDYKLNFKAGGILQEIGTNSGAVMGQGTWQVNGNTVTGTYTMNYSPFNVYSVTGTVNPATKKLTGTWGYDNSTIDGGKMELTRQ